MKKKRYIPITILFLTLCVFITACSSTEEYPDTVPETRDIQTEAPDMQMPGGNQTSDVPATGGNQAAQTPLSVEAEFLSRFPTLFSFSWERDGGAFLNFDMDGTGTGWFDRHGNSVEAPTFLRRDLVPVNYSAYDFDNSGRPTIILRFGGPTCDFAMPLFRFIDGAYREVALLEWGSGWFRDSAGRIVRFYDNRRDGIIGYYHITFSGSSMTRTPILTESGDYDEYGNRQGHFYNHITGERIPFIGDGWYCEAWAAHHAGGTPGTIFGTNETLTPIQPMTDLQNSINAEVRARLGV